MDAPDPWIDFTEQAECLLKHLENALRDTDVYRPLFATKDLAQIQENSTITSEKLTEVSSQLAALAANTSEIAAQGTRAMERIQELSSRLAVSQSSVSTFFRMISNSDVPESDVGIKLIEIANRYKILEKQTELLKAADPQMRWMGAEVEFALAQGDFDLPRRCLLRRCSR
jgi:hypothetical protein